MRTREANKTKRPALVVIQARSPKKTRKKVKSGKEREAPLEESIEHISEIETRQAEIHTDASNATPAATTRARLGPEILVEVEATKEKVVHASKLGSRPKNAGAKLAQVNFSVDVNPDSDEGPTTQKNTTGRKKTASHEPYKVRTAIEARKREQTANNAQALAVNADLGLETRTNGITGASQPVKPTGNQGSHGHSTKRAHTYDFTDPNTQAVRSPMAKRTRGSRLQSGTNASARHVQLTEKANMAIATQKPSVSPLVGVGADIFSSPIDTPANLFAGKGHPQLEVYEMPMDELPEVDEMGVEVEETYYATGDSHDIRTKQKGKGAHQPSRMEGTSERDEITNLESNDDHERQSSEASSSEYEPSARSQGESALNDVDSDTDLGLERLPFNNATPVAITNGRKYRTPFLNETYDAYKKWHTMSDGEDDSDQSSIFIRRGYYGDSLDGPDGSQPLDELLELDEEYRFNVLNPQRNPSSESTRIRQRTANLDFHLTTKETLNKEERERESGNMGDSKFPPIGFHDHRPGVYYELPPTADNTHSFLHNSNITVDHGRWDHSSSGKLQNHGRREAPDAPPLATATANVSQGKSKERADPFTTHGTQISSSQANNPRFASGRIDETLNVVNDFGGMSDQDEDQGDEYLHAKSSPLKDGRRLDNQFIVHIDDTPKARPVNNKHGTKHRLRKGEDPAEESECKATSNSKIRTRVRNKHLPAELTQPVDTWKSLILPTFFNWLASQEDPWNQPQSAIIEALETICRANVRGSYTLKRDGDTSGVKSPEYKRVAQKISDWKSKLGSTAIWAINTLFECRPEVFGDSDEKRVAWADWHQNGCRFLFADVETIPPKGIFQSNAFLHVLGAHFALFATDEKAWVPGLTHDSINREPWGAIAIVAAAVERAVVLWSNRDLTVEIMKRAAKTKSHSIDFPKKMNAKGVETQSHALFAEPKWGPRTQYYYRNIMAKVRKGTWNWAEIYDLLEPHIKALQKREKSQPKGKKPTLEITSADFGDDDLLEDAADMSVGSLSFRPAPSKPWISQPSQAYPEPSHSTPLDWHPASSSNLNPGLLEAPQPSRVTSRSPQPFTLSATTSALTRFPSSQPPPMPGTRRSPYYELGTSQPSAASTAWQLDSDFSREAVSRAISRSSTASEQPSRPTRPHRPPAQASFNPAETYSQDLWESRSKASHSIIPAEVALRHPSRQYRSVSSSSTQAGSSKAQHDNHFTGKRTSSSDSSINRQSSAQDVTAMIPTRPIRARQVPSIARHHSQPEAGPSRRR
ncbi:hypothetical protein Agabi119p4_9965 [Agaricus bisporus var. burnettii]|uniref:Uncharacterized protein n=1 Tax=Agaricus bisporus var. burnettii TaxID=192524 RepID=A0A8H7C4N1_AGABI|nr:hypothetical protein Agabi119p4_9965 [Agaricus bisporus var. burnettii]